MPPIFFAWTRSFWLGALATLAAAASFWLQLDQSALEAFINAWLSPLWASRVTASLPIVSALATALVMHQRSGSARPYTTRLSAETLR